MQAFCPRIDMLKRNRCILRIREAPVCQKLGMILENEVLQKLKLEFFFYKKRSPKLMFLNCFFFSFEKIPLILKIQRFPLSMSILGQKACILGPTIFKISQPN